MSQWESADKPYYFKCGCLSLLVLKHNVSLLHKWCSLASPALFGPGHYKGGNASQFLIMCPIHDVSHFCSPEKLSLLFSSVKHFESAQWMAPWKVVILPVFLQDYSVCCGEAITELKACGVSKKCLTAALKYCYNPSWPHSCQTTVIISKNGCETASVSGRYVSCKDIRNALSPRATYHKIHINLNGTVKFQNVFTETLFQSKKPIACCSVQMAKADELTTVLI